MPNNKDLEEKLKLRRAISKIKKENDIVMNKKKSFINKKKVVAACACLVFATSGIVFAKDIETFIKSKFGLGQGIETAVENGYIGNPNMDYVESTGNENIEVEENEGTILDNIKSEIKIDDFVMDDYNLSADISVHLDNEMSKYITIDKDIKLTFPDLIITDENQTIIYENCSKERFNNYCKDNNLNYKYRDFNENYMNSGLNNFLNYAEHGTDSFSISTKYNMYTSTEYPKSKKLIFNLNKIRIERNGVVYTVLGNWNITLDVPEKMYNRTAEYYKVISCECDNFDVYMAKVTDTGFEIGITLSNTPKPVDSKELYNEKTGTTYGFNSKEELLKVSTDPNFEKAYIEYQKRLVPIQVVHHFPMYGVNWLPLNDGSWIENSNGEKFDCTMNPARKQNGNFTSDDTFDFYETFGMTKNNATDKITTIINYYGEHYKIELEKIPQNNN